MEFNLDIETGNAAMQEPRDITGALREVAASLYSGQTDGPIMDVNGNTVGRYHLEYTEEELSDSPVLLYRCPCCGDDVMDTGPVCSDCREAGCEQTKDACGELGYWECQRDDAYADEILVILPVRHGARDITRALCNEA